MARTACTVGAMRILFIGDIVGRSGRDLLRDRLPQLRERWAVDFVVANGENAAGGAGLNARLAREFLEAGVDGITLGDHVWDQRGFDAEINSLDRVCRPANLPPQCPGRTFLILEKNDLKLAVFTVLGRNFMKIDADSPFLVADRMVEELRRNSDAILCEIHAEATSEKIALGGYLDGRASAVLGTHTHVPTADECVLPRGTAYQTDVGMTGPYASVLGRQVQPVIARFLDGMPRKFEIAEGDVRLCGCLIDLNSRGRAERIERVVERAETEGTPS